ncbi:MAG: hypothetical protein KKE17_07925 [Proteobacteria bacterium]|nr:hypothetical protein [Pseudomonadota bacterium]MBU1709914.1 hypothetical protein [Pseudomonadota bacterium]
MEALLKEIKSLPNIIGSFIYVENQGVEHTDLPRIFRKDGLEKVGRSLDRIFTLNAPSDLAVDSLEIKFNESVAFVQRINQGSSIITFCDPSANLSLVSMTMNMLLPELKNSLAHPKEDEDLPELGDDDLLLPSEPGAGFFEHFDETKAKNASSSTSPAAAKSADPAPAVSDSTTDESQSPGTPQEAGPADIDQLFKVGPFAVTLEKLQDALTRAIGPIGGLIMRDMVEKWLKEGPCTNDRLNALADLLCSEIDNSRLEKEFKSEIAGLLP